MIYQKTVCTFLHYFTPLYAFFRFLYANASKDILWTQYCQRKDPSYKYTPVKVNTRENNNPKNDQNNNINDNNNNSNTNKNDNNKEELTISKNNNHKTTDQKNNDNNDKNNLDNADTNNKSDKEQKPTTPKEYLKSTTQFWINPFDLPPDPLPDNTFTPVFLFLFL